MSPIRSTLAKSVAKLLSFAQEPDIGLVKGRGKGNAERRLLVNGVPLEVQN